MLDLVEREVGRKVNIIGGALHHPARGVGGGEPSRTLPSPTQMDMFIGQQISEKNLIVLKTHVVLNRKRYF